MKMKRQKISNDKFLRETSNAFTKALDEATVKSFRMNFADAAKEYQAVQAEFLARVEDHDTVALEIRRRIAELMLQCAREKKQPFETCQKLWDELVLLGFTNIERRCNMTWFFADCCRKWGQGEIGRSVLGPLIVEIERLLAEPGVKKQAAKHYRYELDNLGKLLAELEGV